MFKKKTVSFRCKNIESGRILNPPLNEVLPPFSKSLEDTTYYSRGLKFGTIEFRFIDANTAYATSLTPVEIEKWILLPIYMDKRIVNIRIGCVTLEIKPVWMVAIALVSSEEPYK